MLYHYILDIDECRSAPCLNEGKCIDRVNSYSCQCKRGFAGTNCEKSKKRMSIFSTVVLR